MRIHWPKLELHAPSAGWLAILATVLVMALALLLTGTSVASSSEQPRVLLSELLFQQQQPLCRECHPDEHEVWAKSVHAKATLDPAFQDELAKSHNQQACLQCHTTGFDNQSGKFLAEGVGCEACHGAYKPGHPAAQTMQLPMESQTCRMCHQAAFQEWETSKHATQKIDCFDCHMAHSQGMRTGSPEKLCSACHNDQKTKLAHSVHGISGVECGSCHMAMETQETMALTGVKITAATHTFAVPSDVCARCHSQEVHAAGTTMQAPDLSKIVEADVQKLQQANQRVNELEAEVTGLNDRLNSLRSIGVVSMGLAFGIGGVMGLLTGVGVMALLSRRKLTEEQG